MNDDTVIAKLETHEFLPHIKTKHELTIYLSEKLMAAFEEAGQKYAIVYDTNIVINIINFNQSLLSHSQEEADTLIIPHCLDIAKCDPYQELYIFFVPILTSFCYLYIIMPRSGEILILGHHWVQRNHRLY